MAGMDSSVARKLEFGDEEGDLNSSNEFLPTEANGDEDKEDLDIIEEETMERLNKLEKMHALQTLHSVGNSGKELVQGVSSWVRPRSASNGTNELNQQPQVDFEIKVFIATWNMQGKPPPLERLFFIPTDECELFVIGAQECEFSLSKTMVRPNLQKKKWEEKLNNTFGDNFHLIQTHTMGSIHIAAYIKKEYVPLLSQVKIGDVATGVGNVLTNKGAVAISFHLGLTSFLFINSHFTAHDKNVLERNAEFHRIHTELVMEAPASTGTSPQTKKQGNVLEKFQRIFWMGDLNYRVSAKRSVVDALIKKGDIEVLLANDQLNVQQKKGAVFQDFVEGQIKFLPTYKFDEGCNVYDTSAKARTPSWTDRILYKSCKHIQLLNYGSCDTMMYTDHRPVFAKLEVCCQVTRDFHFHNKGSNNGSRVCTIL